MRTTLRPARPAAVLTAVIVAILVATGGPALAGVAVQGVLTASAGVTDNVQSAPNDPVPGTLGRQTDLIVTLTPGLTFAAGNRRAVLRLSYLLNGVVYARNTEADSYNNTFIGSAYFIPSKRTTMTVNFNLNEGRISTFNNVADSAQQGTPQLVPPAILDLLSFSGNETLVYEVAKRARLYESLGYATTYQLGGSNEGTPLTQDILGRVGTDYAFARDVIGLDVNYDFANYPAVFGPLIAPSGSVQTDGPIVPRQQQLTLTPLGRWARDFTYFFSMRANLGAVVIIDPANTKNVLTQPAGGLGFNFFGRKAQFDLAYQHAASTNLLLRSNFISDAVTARGVFRLGERSGFSLSLGLGYSYFQQVTIDTQLGAVGQTITADATLAYAPPPIPFASFFLRYNLVDQLGRKSDPTPIPDFYRNTLLFGVALVYPPTISVEAPPRALGVRADGRDAGALSSSKSSTPR